MERENLFRQIDEADALAFLQSLIQINSVNPPGAERAVAEAIKQRLSGTDLQLQLDEVAEGRTNLLVSRPAAGAPEASAKERKTLVFSGHFDTVPVGDVKWKHPAFAGVQVGDRLYGRGATDMKSGVAAMVLALECMAKANIKLAGNLLFMGTVGEEVDCLGAREAVKKGQIDHATAIVVGEPTSNQVVIAHKGALWLEVTMFGKTAHGSMPEHGINAIQAVNRFITALNEYRFQFEIHPVLGNSTINIGMIRGGVSPNVVPDKCSVTIDIRTVPGQDHQAIVAEITQLAKRASESVSAGFQVDIRNDLACVHTSADHPFIKTAIRTHESCFQQKSSPRGVNYYTDASVYQPHLKGIPVLIYGPGEPGLAHQPDEWVDVAKYLDAIRFYMALALDYLQVAGDGPSDN
jgi:succinyl-diaminopimelate desuccinylase